MGRAGTRDSHSGSGPGSGRRSLEQTRSDKIEEGLRDSEKGWMGPHVRPGWV